MQDFPDEKLMSLAINNDVCAFETLFLRYQRRLFAFFYRMSPDVEGAKDCCQETFLKLWRDRARYVSKGKFSTYLFRIAKNHFVDRYRHQKSRVNFQTRSLDCPEAESMKSGRLTDPFNAAVESEMALVVMSAIARLPEMHRLVYVLSEEQHLSYRDIAEIVGCPIGTVSSRKVEAMKKLRSLLTPLKNELLSDGT
jgi:RNA polymerase sigma-70 factor, ECF subfamily